MRSLERGDDLAARRVIFRVGREDQRQIERQPHRIPFDLDVALLHDVEESHLDLARQIRQFIDGEDAAIGARQQAVVDRQFVRYVLAAARRLDRVYVADHIRDGDVGGGQFLHVALLAAQPGYGRLLGALGDQVPAPAADRSIGAVVNLTALHVRKILIQ